MEKAIAEVERLENLPLPYQERLPRVDLSNRFYGTALALLLILVAFRMLEVKTWDA
jgi:mxaC protein